MQCWIKQIKVELTTRLTLAAFIYASMLTCIPSIVAYAGFEDDYGHWIQLSVQEKRAYVMGIFDYASQTAITDEEQAFSLGLQKCGQQVHLSSQMLLESIDDYLEIIKVNGVSPLQASLLQQSYMKYASHILIRN
jgi:hypothetical protein